MRCSLRVHSGGSEADAGRLTNKGACNILVILTVQEAIETELLKALTERLCIATASTIYPVYNEILANATAQQLTAAGVPLATLIEAVREHEALFLRYAATSLLAARGAPVEQAYSALEKSEAPRWRVLATLGVSKDFVIPHMINFWFLLKNPAGLEGYLKAIRLPGAAKQARALRKCFAQATQAQ